MADKSDKESTGTPDPTKMFSGESVTHHVTTEVSPPESRIATGGITSAPPKVNNPDTGDVELYMAYPQDRFKFGEGEDDVLVGHKTKKFSRNEADRILGLARMSNVQVLERKPEDNS